MKFSVLFLTLNGGLHSVVQTARVGLVPPNLRIDIDGIGTNINWVVLSEKISENDISLEKLCEIIRRRESHMLESDISVLFLDNRFARTAEKFGEIFPCLYLDENRCDKNYLAARIAESVRRVRILKRKFDKLSDRIPMLLPRSFFISDKVAALGNLVDTFGHCELVELAKNLEKRISEVVKVHKKPSRKQGAGSEAPRRYIDDRANAFVWT
jgi:hypothetical protein